MTMRTVLVVVLLWGGCAVRGEALGALEAVLPSYLLDNLEDLVKAASAACEILPLDLFFSRQFTTDLPQLDVVEFTRTSRRSYRVTSAHLHLRNWPGSALVLYIPGWWNTPNDEAATGLVSALLKEHPAILVLDTRRSFGRGYLSAATRVNAVSHHLYILIKNLSKIGVSPTTVHLIGFSLGAHVAGITGKLVQKGLRAKLGKITALDPAKPCFTQSEYRLQKTDAKFVQVIHSSAGVLGLEEPIGHTDVYVNGVAVRQPECKHRSISFECDHNQSWKLYAASVVNSRAMTGRRCVSWDEVVGGRCSGSPAAVGYGCSDTARASGGVLVRVASRHSFMSVTRRRGVAALAGAARRGSPSRARRGAELRRTSCTAYDSRNVYTTVYYLYVVYKFQIPWYDSTPFCVTDMPLNDTFGVDTETHGLG